MKPIYTTQPQVRAVGRALASNLMEDGMETKHTPGPWGVEPVAATLSAQQHDFLVVHSSNGLRSHVARLFDNALCDEHGTTAANARLIAAAPDLLAALEECYAVLQVAFSADEDPFGASHNRALDADSAARAAIARAKGVA